MDYAEGGDHKVKLDRDDSLRKVSEWFPLVVPVGVGLVMFCVSIFNKWKRNTVPRMLSAFSRRRDAIMGGLIILILGTHVLIEKSLKWDLSTTQIIEFFVTALVLCWFTFHAVHSFWISRLSTRVIKRPSEPIKIWSPLKSLSFPAIVFILIAAFGIYSVLTNPDRWTRLLESHDVTGSR